MENKHFTYKGENISYGISGKDSAVVLLHGFGEDSDVWHYQVDFLKDHFRIIVPDIPGSGASPLNEQLTTIEDYSEAIKAILDNENITQAVLIGHSMGGYIALALAQKYPHLLKAFGLFHSTAFPDSEEKKQARLKSIEFIKLNGAYSFIKTSTPGLFSEEFKINHAKIVEALIERNKKFLP